ncbi:MAG: cytochrome c biogenesis protein CcsA [Elusimicrobia bacterium]|nr:cytochrome c biogenesis protein CcsA [Elusimicrobiota bacterium]
MALELSRLALAFYCAATAAALGCLRRRNGGWGRWSLRLLAAGACLQASAFLASLPAFWAGAGGRWRLPLHTPFGVLTLLSLAVAATFFIVESRRRLGILGAFVLPWAVLFCGAAVLASPAAAAAPPAAGGWWTGFHPVLLAAAYAAFANAFGVGVAWLIQERQLKSRRPDELCYRLPALELLDGLHFRLVAVGCAHMGAGLVLGGLWARKVWTPSLLWDPKILGACATAAGYASFLYLHSSRGWRGRRGVFAAMIAFCVLAATFLGGDLMSRFHGFLLRGP